MGCEILDAKAQMGSRMHTIPEGQLEASRAVHRRLEGPLACKAGQCDP